MKHWFALRYKLDGANWFNSSPRAHKPKLMKTPVTVWKCKCERCGAKWVSRVDNPKRCAKCKTPYWNVKKK